MYSFITILVSFICLTGTTAGFLFDTKCVAPPPCMCRSNNILCDYRQLTQVPVFIRHNKHYYHINVSLNNNELTTIPAYAFTNLSALNATSINLYLYYNQISSIETHAFNGVEHTVTELDLKHNNLTHLPLALTELSSLHKLYLLGNPLVKLDASVLANIGSSLYSFDFTVGQFSSFPNELQLLTTLSILKMDYILFPMLNATVFQGFENSLTSLEIQYAFDFDSTPAAVCRLNSLQSFSMHLSPSLGKYNSSIFDKCNHQMTNVTFLSLQNDYLRTIPKLGQIFPSLQTLHLYGNDLHFIENSSLAGLTSLMDLHLGLNHFTRIPFAVNMAVNLRQLWIGNNQIDTVEDLDLLRLHNLTSLYLDYNPIVYVSPFAFTHNPFLDYIGMYATKIRHVPRALLRLEKLHTVYLSDKLIECSCNETHYLKSWNLESVNLYGTCSSGKFVETYLAIDLPKCP